MPTVYLCDRCGGEIKPDFINFLSHKAFFAKIQNHVNNIETVFDADMSKWKDKRGTDLYICKNCEKSFIKWFANSGRRDGVST